jgi:TetR/AcrR family transcriptional repressor of nem operon
MSASDAALPRHTALRAMEITVDEGRDVNAAPNIVDSAVHAFDELGYEQSSISHIAELAGISKSLVTYYFPTKRALAAAVIDLAYPGGVFMGADRGADDPLDAIVWIAEHVTTNVLHNPLARVALKLQDQEAIDAQRPAGTFLGWLARFTDYLEEAQTQGLISSQTDPVTEARYLLSGIVGLITVAQSTGARLTLVDDAIQITRDRLGYLQKDAPLPERRKRDRRAPDASNCTAPSLPFQGPVGFAHGLHYSVPSAQNS